MNLINFAPSYYWRNRTLTKRRQIELLAPAKNLVSGIEAINHGADAVYIGAPKFGARSAVGNSLEDIKSLVDYAHLFGVRVYVALNTILYDSELEEARSLIWDLYKINIDALIIQDMGLLMLDLPPIPLHASTQVDNRNLEKIKFLSEIGFSQIVLARELTINEIKHISSKTDITLEVFIHGALCVCYSGQCYLSEALSKRSANRGTCAQYCRLPYTLIDSNNEIIERKKHLLSMKDLNLSDDLEKLINAGASSLKIEGRLKDISYVKNVVAYYRRKLDDLFLTRNDLTRSSVGNTTYTFTPNLNKSFNRGYTQYFFNGRVPDMWSLDTPKSIGEPIGIIKSIQKNYFTIDTDIQLSNGDGLCFISPISNKLQGIRINKIEGKSIYINDIKKVDLKNGLFVYRNYDHEFEKLLSKKSAERKINTTISITEILQGFELDIIDESDVSFIIQVKKEKELAQKDQSLNILNNLSKSGNTIFSVKNVKINFSENWFIPSSLLSEWKRLLFDGLSKARTNSHHIEYKKLQRTNTPYFQKELTYLGNVLNNESANFYKQHQVSITQRAFEKEPLKNVPLMFTRHCIKQAMGWCPKDTKVKLIYKEPFFLLYNDVKLKLEFDCKNCDMKVYKE